MKTIYVLECQEDDHNDRRRVVGRFMTKDGVKQVAQSLGLNHSWVHEEQAFESYHEWQDHRPEAVRERALAKLTTEEKEALGIKS